MSSLRSTIYMVMALLISLKIIDFNHLEFLDVCIIILFLVMVALQISNHFRKSDK